MQTSARRPHAVALVAMPWQDVHAPSIQLGALKSYVERELPAVQVDCYSYYVELADVVGIERAQAISHGSTLLGEVMFAYHLFPEHRASILALAAEKQAACRELAGIDLVNDLIVPIEASLRRRLDAVDWSRYLCVGFSVVFAQLTASLYMAAQVRARAPGIPIVFGGPSVAGRIGESLLQRFPQLDWVVNGEGELPLTELCTRLLAGDRAGVADVPSVTARAADRIEHAEHPEHPEHRARPAPERVLQQVPSLAGMPAPDFQPYFDAVDRLIARDVVLRRVTLPVEGSRGCWWDRSHRDPMLSCSFCNLNLQWTGYREKSTGQFVGEVSALVERHHVLDFIWVDNILRHKGIEDLCEQLGRLGQVFRVFIEARASVKPAQMALLRKVGVRRIQFGIEALSTGILRLINKGTTTLQNLQVMKFSAAFGIDNGSNIITRHPGANPDDVRETLKNIAFASCYQPLSVSTFVLTYESPIYKNPDAFGVRNVRNADGLDRCFPPDVADAIFWPDKSYDLDLSPELDALWSEVEKAVGGWALRYRAQVERWGIDCLLLYHDGRSFLRIMDYRASLPRVIELGAVERQIYLACTEARTLSAIHAASPALSKDEVRSVLDAMVDARLVFREGDRYLALAIPEDREQRAQMLQHTPAEAARPDAPRRALPMAGRSS